MAARLAVLSACESGRRGSRVGVDHLGLTMSLLRAGVETLLVSHWRVRDDVATSVMKSIYRALAGRLPVRNAHRRAIVQIREKFPHPDHWASFSVWGDPRC